MAVNLALQEIQSFGYCSMQYHLRFRHGFPWFPASYEVAVAQGSRDAIAHWLLGQMGPIAAKTASKFAHTMIDRTHDLALQYTAAKGRKVADHTSRRTDAHMGLELMEKVFDRRRDKMIGVNTPYAVEFEDYRVTGTIDAVFDYMGTSKTPTRTFLVQGQLDDPIEDNVNWGNLKKGFAIRTIHEGTRFLSNVRFVEFGVLRGPTRFKFQPAESTARLEFETIVKQVSAGIASGFAVPTAHPEKCRHCPFKVVCKPSLADATRGILETAKARVLEEAQQSPFWSKS